jgi:hypothetical protein
MVARTPDDADHRPLDELGPELRQAVEDVLSQPPPEDLMRQVLDGLRDRRRRGARSSVPRLALLGVLAAAAGMAVVVWLGQDRNGAGGNVGPAPPPPVAAQPAEQLPTLWAYHRASLESPEALERLLDEHAAHLLVTESKPLRMGAFLGLAQETL